MSSAESRFFSGPAGRLDARIHGDADGAPVLLLHPHPQYGGTMGSRLVYDVAVGLGDAGFRAVRFDYRGVGRSEGQYGQGDGETEDAEAVFDAIATDEAIPAVIGHSFGAAVATRLATRRDLGHLVLVASPPRVRSSNLSPLDDAPDVGCPVDIIVGDQDPLVSVDEAGRLADALPTCAGLRVLAGADHFLTPEHTGRVLRVVLDLLEPHRR